MAAFSFPPALSASGVGRGEKRKRRSAHRNAARLAVSSAGGAELRPCARTAEPPLGATALGPGLAAGWGGSDSSHGPSPEGGRREEAPAPGRRGAAQRRRDPRILRAPFPPNQLLWTQLPPADFCKRGSRLPDLQGAGALPARPGVSPTAARAGICASRGQTHGRRGPAASHGC